MLEEPVRQLQERLRIYAGNNGIEYYIPWKAPWSVRSRRLDFNLAADYVCNEELTRFRDMSAEEVYNTLKSEE